MLEVTSRRLMAFALGLLFLASCSGQKIKTHPVAGKVEITGGDVSLLAGSQVELKSDSDDSIRPYGIIDAAGNFELKTLYQGEVVPGAPEGKYKARISLADPADEGVPKRKGNPFHKRFLEFDTSKLSYTIPASNLAVTLSQK